MLVAERQAKSYLEWMRVCSAVWFSRIKGKHIEASKCLTMLCSVKLGSMCKANVGLHATVLVKSDLLCMSKRCIWSWFTWYAFASIWCWWICFHIWLNSTVGFPYFCGLVNHSIIFNDINNVVSLTKDRKLSCLAGHCETYCSFVSRGNQTSGKLEIDEVLTAISSRTVLSARSTLNPEGQDHFSLLMLALLGKSPCWETGAWMENLFHNFFPPTKVLLMAFYNARILFPDTWCDRSDLIKRWGEIAATAFLQSTRELIQFNVNQTVLIDLDLFFTIRCF